jgi:tripartite-type tricarboxylate transporter receptor subunit TctC
MKKTGDNNESCDRAPQVFQEVAMNIVFRGWAKERYRLWACIAIAAALAGCTSAHAQGQAYPAKPIRLVVPFATGGVTDTPWRIVSAKLAEDFGGQVLVENRPGAGASIGAAIVAAAPADGYTLLGTSSSHVMTGVTFKKLPYDSIADFVSVAQIAESCQALVVHPSFPVRSVAQLVALAKSQPGKLDYSTSGTGTAPHLYHELFMSISGIKMNHIPYKGISQQVPDLVAGRVP